MSPLENSIVNLWENESEKGKQHLSIYPENNVNLVTPEKVSDKSIGSGSYLENWCCKVYSMRF